MAGGGDLPKRSICRIAPSVARNSKAPASDVIVPPSNPSTTVRRSTGANSNSSALHSVGIGALLEPENCRCGTTAFADSRPDALIHCEISRLANDMKGYCSVCGGTTFAYRPILWQSLVDEWQLAPAEADYVNRQQGQACTSCGANLRSIALADALRAAFGASETLVAFCASSRSSAIRILELNEAGSLHPVLSRLPGHVFRAYPEVDMHALPFADGAFDLVVHSDTLEHVPNPLHALAECRRIIRQGGALCYTVPLVVGRLSRDRSGLPKSYHGNPTETGDDYVVHTEFGADAWTYPMRAGFSEVRLYGMEHPAAHSIAAYR